MKISQTVEKLCSNIVEWDEKKKTDNSKKQLKNEKLNFIQIYHRFFFSYFSFLYFNIVVN